LLVKSAAEMKLDMRSFRLHRLLIAASVVVPATLFGAAAIRDRQEILREGEATAVRTAAVMQEHASKVFETGQLVLGWVDGRIRDQDWAAIAEPDTSAFLARVKAPLEQVVSIWITNAQGFVQAGSQAWDPTVDLSGRDFFRVHREGQAGTYVSTPFRGLATGVTSIAVSQRRTTADGRFDGTIHLALSPDYFARFFADAAPNLTYAATILRTDGHILARQPPGPSTEALRPTSPLMRQVAQSPAGGIFSARSSLDGTERIYAYRRINGYPLYVGFGIETATLLQRWKTNLVVFGTAAACN
jgi:hypothetical protein